MSIKITPHVFNKFVLQILRVKEIKSSLHVYSESSPIPKMLPLYFISSVWKHNTSTSTDRPFTVSFYRTTRLLLPQIQSILKFLKLDCQITDCRRMGTFKDGRHRTILATMPCMYDKRILLLHLTTTTNTCISKDYSLQEEEQLNICLKKRKDLIDAVFPRKKLKVMNLTLYEKQD